MINRAHDDNKTWISPILTFKLRYNYVMPGLLRFLEYGKCFLKLPLIFNQSTNPNKRYSDSAPLINIFLAKSSAKANNYDNYTVIKYIKL